MGRIERIIVTLLLAVLCPFLLFVLFWWTAAALVINGLLPIPESGVAVGAFVGLALGVVLDALFLRRWAARFYTAGVRRLVLVYLICSAVAVAFFMGLPLGNLALGTLAGVYAGRRRRHAGAGPLGAAGRRVGLFTALVTGTEALPIGLLALGDEPSVALLRGLTGLDAAALAGPAGVAIVVVLCALLMAIQYGCTRAAARLAFGGEAGAGSDG